MTEMTRWCMGSFCSIADLSPMGFPNEAGGLAQHGGPHSWLEESDPAKGVILYVMDGPFRLPWS
jgi:hypothetical protein